MRAQRRRALAARRRRTGAGAAVGRRPSKVESAGCFVQELGKVSWVWMEVFGGFWCYGRLEKAGVISDIAFALCECIIREKLCEGQSSKRHFTRRLCKVYVGD